MSKKQTITYNTIQIYMESSRKKAMPKKKKKTPFCIQLSPYVRVNQDALNERAKENLFENKKKYLK